MNTYVAVDVETTGLDPQRDSIIEVAAVTFREDGTIVDEFASFARPDGPIPPFITQLTGITEAMVAGAPSMFTLRSRLRGRLGDHTLVGHNISFDMGFLEQARIGVGQPRLDTVVLAAALFPTAGRYSLDALARYLQLPSLQGQQTHRALDDARLTVELFWVLQQRVRELSASQLDEIVRAGQLIHWPETSFFEAALRDVARTAFGAKLGQLPRLFNPELSSAPAPVAKENPDLIDVDVIADMLQPGGNFNRQFPDYEYRSEQVQMVRAVAETLNQGAKLMVEAGTGTGKSIGYLLPAAFWATLNGRRVFVSTNTINLQDQLMHKDLPVLQQILPFELRTAILKGKRNYLCTRLFRQMRRTGPRTADEMALYARIITWLPGSNSGDLSEISLRHSAERMAWGRMNAENDVCGREICAQEKCPLHVARRRAEQAHIVVVNHSLLLADINARFLPEYYDVIIDEAHHLEAAVTDGLSFRADKRFLDAILEEVRGRAGIIGDVLSAIKDIPPDFQAPIDSFILSLREHAVYGASYVAEFFTALAYFCDNQESGRSQFAQQIRLTMSARTLPDFDTVEVNWEDLNRNLQQISKGLRQLASGLEDISGAFPLEGGEDLLVALIKRSQDLEEVRSYIQAIISEPDELMIYWIERFKDAVSLHAAPLHVGPLVENHIFNEMETVVLTSATMRTADPYNNMEPSFGYIRERLHAQDAGELAVGSPFDYPNAALLYLVTDIPEPNQPGYQRYVEEAIVDVARHLGGRTMVLFTSYSQLKQTTQAVEGPLSDEGIMVLAQTQGTSRQQLLEQFKAPDARAVLLGTRSFWEGVDVPGAALQAVLIAKLPFDVPSDPIFAARSETFESPFFEYSIPEAVLRFRQGFGRLIRRQSDEGAVIILDKRVLTKRYGQMFLEALPECMVLRQRAARVGELTLRWLNRER